MLQIPVNTKRFVAEDCKFSVKHARVVIFMGCVLPIKFLHHLLNWTSNFFQPPKSTDVSTNYDQPVCKDLLVLCTGWRVYAKQKVALAGIGLSCLYMTVLGFHTVTIGKLCDEQ